MRRIEVLAALAGWALAAAAGCAAQHADVGAAGSATATSATATSATASGGPSGGTSQPVPWVDDPASPYAAPAVPAPASPVAQYPACSAAQLTGYPGNSVPGAGNVYTYFVLTNVSAQPCTIEGGPSSAVGFAADGSQHVLGTAAMNQWGSLIGPPVNLRPGQSAQAVTDSGVAGDMCSSSVTFAFVAVAIGIGDTGSVRVDFPNGKPLTLYLCGAAVPSVLGFGVPAPNAGPPPSPLDVLTVSRSMPGAVPPGGTADYTVTLTNPTGQAVALTPCPSYAEFMVVTGAGQPTDPLKATSYYYLNCQAVPRIPGHASVTFDMRIQVPTGSGTAKYGWQLQGTALETGGVTTLG